MTTDRL
jgi:Cyclin, N-terminal domain